MPEIVITSLRGGMNDSDPPIALAEDQCVLAQNVEFYRSMLGERRRGAIEILVSGALAACSRIVWTHRHLPTTDPGDAQFWAMGINGSTAVMAYKDTTWHTVTMADAPTVDGTSEYQVRGVTLHGKLFVAYNSSVDRLHVWDGSIFRRVGLAPLTTAPTAADTGSGSFTTTRYYRVREAFISGSTRLRSEPSAVLTKTPSGFGTGLVVTKPATLNTDPAATHWELEASLNNADFYFIAIAAIGTTTITDSTSAAGGYGEYELSEDIGDYYPPHSARILIPDEDRLGLCGSFEDSALDSSFSWTPVYNATGVGNDERITLDPVSVVNLDGFEGGSITDAGRWAQGEIGIFKQAHTYKLIRTGNRQRAYDAFPVSKAVGAVSGSVVEGVDDSGNAALYFLDPSVGPYRFTVRGGLQRCGADVREAWATVNLDAAVVARSLFYSTNKQVLWCVATGASTVPDLGLKIQTDAMQTVENGEARRGYATVTGPSAGALTMCLFSSNIDAGVDRSRTLVPFIGVVGDGLVWRCDTGDDDNGTEYAARITTKPYSPTNLQTDVEIKSATLVGKAQAGAELVVSVIVNGGTSTTQIGEDIDLTPEGSETFVICHRDDLSVAECQTFQFDLADVASPGARWEIARLSTTLSGGQGR